MVNGESDGPCYPAPLKFGTGCGTRNLTVIQSASLLSLQMGCLTPINGLKIGVTEVINNPTYGAN